MILPRVPTMEPSNRTMSGTTEEKARPARWMRVLLVLLPAWLVASAVVAVWAYFHRERERELERNEAFAREVSTQGIADDLRKLGEVIGERNPSSPATSVNLSRTAAMIEGVLGPSNTGYPVRRIPGPTDWPILQATLQGTDAQAAPIWVVCGYDSPRGTSGAAPLEASGLAANLAVAQSLAGSRPRRTVHFAFVPHAWDPQSPVKETMEILLRTITAPATVCWVDVMGTGDELRVSPCGEHRPAEGPLVGLGRIITGEPASGAVAFFVNLAGPGLGVSRVATSAPRAEGRPTPAAPDASQVAASGGRLVEWIRRQAALP